MIVCLSIDLEDAISAENCVQLEAPLEDDVTGNYIVPSCQIFLFCNDSHQMGSVSILSEARVIEVYGYHGEYLSTLKNELMEEVDGMSVFRGDLTIVRPLKECCLKVCLHSMDQQNCIICHKARISYVLQVIKQDPGFGDTILFIAA